MPSNPTFPVSRDEWSEQITKWRASELTRIEYCHRHGLAFNAFIYQINRRQEADAGSGAGRRNGVRFQDIERSQRDHRNHPKQLKQFLGR